MPSKIEWTEETWNPVRGCSKVSTGCEYCLPCPEGVVIPEIFNFFNEHSTKRGDQDAQQEVVKRYAEAIPPENGAKRCAKCGQCEEKCPQKLPVRKLVQQAGWVFERDR